MHYEGYGQTFTKCSALPMDLPYVLHEESSISNTTTISKDYLINIKNPVKWVSQVCCHINSLGPSDAYMRVSKLITLDLDNGITHSRRQAII